MATCESFNADNVWQAASPRMALPALGHRLLGRLRMATHKLNESRIEAHPQ